MKVSRLFYFGGFATCISSALVSHTKLPIPPALVIFGFVFLLFLFLYLSKFGNSKIPLYSLIVLPFAFFLIFTQPFTNASIKNYVGPIVSALFFPLTVYFLNNIDFKQLKKILKVLIILSLIVLFFETLWRYLFPNFEIQEASENRGTDDVFYMFKSVSLMYSDSNGAALHIAIILFFTYYWSEFVNKKFFLVKVILWVVLIFTISRAAWMGSIIGLLFFKFLRGKSVLFWFFLGSILIIASLFFFFFYLFPLMEKDPSFMERLEVFNDAIKYYRDSARLMDVFIGIGVYMSKAYFSIYLHNFYIVQAVEMGIVSLLLLFIMWGQFIYYSNGRALIILVPYSIIVLSSTLSFIPVFYVVLGIICVCQNRFKNENSIYCTSVSK